MHKRLGKSLFCYKILMHYATILRLLQRASPQIQRLKNSNSDMRNKADYSTTITHIKFLYRLTVAQPINHSEFFYGTYSIITAITKGQHCPRPDSIQYGLHVQTMFLSGHFSYCALG
jgi:hypothetical protein